MYFCTFTCYDWMNLFEHCDGYDIIYNWFHLLKKERIEVIGYVIMPNHVHFILYFPEPGFKMNKIISNGKRFMAYEIINRLQIANNSHTLKILGDALTPRERKKHQLHKVFKASFDAKAIFSEKFLIQKLNYIHNNPISGKWKLVIDAVLYEHSSAAYYENGTSRHFEPKHFNDL